MAISQRVLLFLAFLLFVAFAAYGSFVPFDLHRVPLSDAIARFRAVPAADPWHASRTDFLANVLLFVPIGFTLAGAIAGRSRGLAVIAVPLAAAAGLTISIGIEFGQIFAGGRTPSWNDVMAETIGGVMGATAWLAAGPLVADWLRPLAGQGTPLGRARRLLGLYAAGWLVLHLLPFDFTLRVSELADKYRSGRIVVKPFADVPGAWEALMAVVAGALQAIPIGALAVLTLTGVPVLTAVLAGCVVIGVTELGQLLAMSRTADTTDVIAGIAGIAAGGFLAHRWNVSAGGSHAGIAAQSGRAFRPWALAALCGWMAVLMVRHWSPFDFVISRPMFESRVGLLFQLPFRSYYWSDYVAALGEAFTKILLGVPVGAFLQVSWRLPRARALQWLQRGFFAVTATAIFLVIELGQVLLPSRVPDGTDVLLAVAGAGLGVLSVLLLSADTARTRGERHAGGQQLAIRERQ
jgi:glycopeptide antibiotics resistance protein